MPCDTIINSLNSYHFARLCNKLIVIKTGPNLNPKIYLITKQIKRDCESQLKILISVKISKNR